VPEEKKEESPGGFLKGLLDKVGGSEPEQRASAPVALVIALVAITIIGVLGFFLLRARRKAAQLRSKMRRMEEEQAQEKENAKLAKNAEYRKAAENRVQDLQASIDRTSEELQQLSELNAGRKETLRDLTDWDDLVLVDKRGEP